MDERESKNTGSVDTVDTTVLAKLLTEKNIPVASFLKNFMQVLFVGLTLIDNRYAVDVK